MKWRTVLLLVLTLALGMSGEALARGRGGTYHRSATYYRSSEHHTSSHRSYSSHPKSSRSYRSRTSHSSRTRSISTSTRHRAAPHHYHAPKTYHPRYRAAGVRRDSHGRIARSEAARREFMRMTGYPHGRPGYVIDHIIPLKRGGADDPSNMQWQTKEEAKAKDRWE